VATEYETVAKTKGGTVYGVYWHFWDSTVLDETNSWVAANGSNADQYLNSQLNDCRDGDSDGECGRLALALLDKPDGDWVALCEQVKGMCYNTGSAQAMPFWNEVFFDASLFLGGYGLGKLGVSGVSELLGSDAATEAAGGAGDALVLGKYPDYIKLADELGARRFSIPDAEWNALTPEARWAANQAVLDQAIADRIPIVLSNPATPEFLTGTYGDEISYLIKQGYEIGPNAMSMVPKGG
jgi:hypothetical protein